MKFLPRFIQKLITRNERHKHDREVALKIQAEMLVLKSIFMRSSIALLAQNTDLIKAVKYSCLTEIQNLQLSGISAEDQKRFRVYAETALEDMFARVRINDRTLETLN